MMFRLVFVGVAMSALNPHAFAQEALTACGSQQELEQVVGSGGQIMPDGCRNATVSVLESDGVRLCLIDFSSNGEGIVDQLREAAVNEKWWVRCDELGAASQ